MIRFARLFEAIDRTTSTNDKVEAMAAYFRPPSPPGLRRTSGAPPADAAWAVFFLTGRRLKRLLPYAALQQWTLDATGLPGWMIEEAYAIVGDGAETMALLLDQLPREEAAPLSLAEWVEERILKLKALDPASQQARATAWFRELDRWQRFILLKLLTGELRIGVSQTLVVRALAAATGHATTAIAARLMGDWSPTAAWFESLSSADSTIADLSRPYPFCLAAPLEDEVTTLGSLADWQVEWKWDGIRAQLVHRGGSTHLWSRGEELITHRFPEIAAAATRLPDSIVLDGEVLAFQDDRPAPFSALQQRIGRQKQVAQMARAVPVVFMTYDLLEHEGRDVRGEPLSWRRQTLDALLGTSSLQASKPPDLQAPKPSSLQAPRSSHLRGHETEGRYGGPTVARRRTRRAEVGSPQASRGVLRTSPIVIAADWAELARLRGESRARGVEGFMIKRLASTYGVGRKRGEWWKWKVDPYSIDAVLIYAQPGSGKRASLLTDYTFGVWDGDTLVPVAKAYSGLSNEEIAECDAWIRRHTRERFGPVRHVEPVQVFELGFEGIARSSRHKSGVAVRFPRMLRWRKDKPASEADTLENVRALLGKTGEGPL